MKTLGFIVAMVHVGIYVVYILAVCSDGCGKAQHVADDNCIIVIPEIITDATPCTIV